MEAVILGEKEDLECLSQNMPFNWDVQGKRKHD
jgi:hypothetical protein